MSGRQFKACLAPVFNRGTPPASFLNELIEWGRNAPDILFAPNSVPVDIYTVIKSRLGERQFTDYAGTEIKAWVSPLHRKSAALEVMRVHAGMESSWNWNEGMDKTNATSQRNIEGQETGIFQVSFDSTRLGNNAMLPFAKAHEIDTPAKFIPTMKSNHVLALDYYMRLARVSIQWAGPLLRHGNDSVYPWLRHDSMMEFQTFLK